eukprot:1172327-Prymnesium_polylepis.1
MEGAGGGMEEGWVVGGRRKCRLECAARGSIRGACWRAGRCVAALRRGTWRLGRTSLELVEGGVDGGLEEGEGHARLGRHRLLRAACEHAAPRARLSRVCLT